MGTSQSDVIGGWRFFLSLGGLFCINGTKIDNDKGKHCQLLEKSGNELVNYTVLEIPTVSNNHKK